MQSKNIGRYQVFEALPVQIYITKNSINTDTGFSISASPLEFHSKFHYLTFYIIMSCLVPQ